MYGKELKHTRLCNRKARIIFALFGEIYPGYLNRFFVNKQYLKKYGSSEKKNIVEIGSANGAFCFWLSRDKKNTVTGVDVDENLVHDCENIRKKIGRNNLSFICADATTKFTQGNVFDIVISTHTLEHILDDQAVLVNAFNSLKRGGILLLQVPYGNPQKPPSKEDLDNGHVRAGYTESYIRQNLECAGFEIITMTGSIGRIGRFAYSFSRKLAKGRMIINLSTLFFPITLTLMYLEQVASLLRKRELPFEYSPLVLARRPGG